MTSKIKYILLIANCKKYEFKKQKQKELWVNDLNIYKFKYYHVIGDENIKNYVFDHKENILYVNTEDDYIHLPKKMIRAFEACLKEFPNLKYIFKTDDDQNLLKKDFFNNLVPFVKEDYGGLNVVIDDNHDMIYDIYHNELKGLELEKCIYCSGRFYFLSKKALLILLNHKYEIEKRLIEDHAMGFYLKDYNDLKKINIQTNKIFEDIKF